MMCLLSLVSVAKAMPVKYFLPGDLHLEVACFPTIPRPVFATASMCCPKRCGAVCAGVSTATSACRSQRAAGGLRPSQPRPREAHSPTGCKRRALVPELPQDELDAGCHVSACW